MNNQFDQWWLDKDKEAYRHIREALEMAFNAGAEVIPPTTLCTKWVNIYDHDFRYVPGTRLFSTEKEARDSAGLCHGQLVATVQVHFNPRSDDPRYYPRADRCGP